MTLSKLKNIKLKKKRCNSMKKGNIILLVTMLVLLLVATATASSQPDNITPAENGSY